MPLRFTCEGVRPPPRASVRSGQQRLEAGLVAQRGEVAVVRHPGTITPAEPHRALKQVDGAIARKPGRRS